MINTTTTKLNYLALYLLFSIEKYSWFQWNFRIIRTDKTTYTELHTIHCHCVSLQDKPLPWHQGGRRDPPQLSSKKTSLSWPKTFLDGFIKPLASASPEDFLCQTQYENHYQKRHYEKVQTNKPRNNVNIYPSDQLLPVFFPKFALLTCIKWIQSCWIWVSW